MPRSPTASRSRPRSRRSPTASSQRSSSATTGRRSPRSTSGSSRRSPTRRATSSRTASSPRRPRSTRASSSARATRSSAAGSPSTSTRPASRSASPGAPRRALRRLVTRPRTDDGAAGASPRRRFGYSPGCSGAGRVDPQRAAFLERLRGKNTSARTVRRVSRLLPDAGTHDHLAFALGAGSGARHTAERAEQWFGEPFLHPGEDPVVALAPGTARRGALDDALDGDRRRPPRAVPELEGPLRADARPRARARREAAGHASGTDLRRHQVDALAGMLTELIAATQASRGERQRQRRERERRRARRRAGGRGGRGRRARRRGARGGHVRRRGPGRRHAASASATRRPPARRSPRPGFVEAARTRAS